MSCIRYKFKSALEYDKVTFEGLQISLTDLREKIMSLKKMSLTDNFTLDIMDAQTKKIYTDDSVMISRNSTVVVMRVPKLSQQQLSRISQMKDTYPPQNVRQDDAMLSAEQLKKTADLAGANASEEDKVHAMMSQAGEDYNPLNYAKFKARGILMPGIKPPPPNYICHRCNQKGHWIKFCPTNGDPAFDNMRLKRSSGIPNSHVAMAASSSVPGAMMDRFGNVVVRTVDLAAASDGPKRKVAAVTELEEETLPPELTCSICKELVRDAVIIPCCAESFCDECIRVYLLENDFTCYTCKVVDVSPETLVPNKSLRAAAKKFQSRQTEKRSISLARGLPSTIFKEAIPPQPFPVTTTGTITIATTTSLSTGTTTAVQTRDSKISPLGSEMQNSEQQEMVDNAVEQTKGNNSLVQVERTPSPSVCITVTSVNDTVVTSSSTATQVSPPKANITAPIVIPPPIHRYPPTVRSQPSILLPIYPTPLPPAVLNPFLAPSRPSSHPSSMMRLTELLAAAERHDGRNSPPPLSAEEFYLQQKMFRNIAGGSSRGGSFSSRSPSPYSSGSYSSRSPSPVRSRSPHSKSSRSHRHTHRHHLSERAKRKRKETEKIQSDKHKHKHKKKKRKHSHSTPDESPPPITTESTSDPTPTMTEVNGTDEIQTQGVLLPAASTEVENGSPVSLESTTVPVMEEPVVASCSSEAVDTKIRKKKKHKERKEREHEIALRTTLARHHKHRHHNDTKYRSDKSKKKLKKTSHD